MTKAKSGDTVRVHYRGTLDDGTEFDSSAGRDPIEFTLGTGSVIAGFDDAVTGMIVGDRKTVTIAATDAYGPHRQELVQDVDRGAFPDDLELYSGRRLQATTPEGEDIGLTVIGVGEDSVTVDMNHPLAGEDLTFELEMVEIG